MISCVKIGYGFGLVSVVRLCRDRLGVCEGVWIGFLG